MAHSTISDSDTFMTFMNVFTVDPTRQEELLDLLAEAGEVMVGLISADLHRSADGTRVVDDATWRSSADVEAMQPDPRAVPHMQKAADMSSCDPSVRTVAHATLP